MTPSLRTFLLINLLLSVTLITSLAIIGNLFLAHRDIQNHLDSQLLRDTYRLETLLSNSNQQQISEIQRTVNVSGEKIPVALKKKYHSAQQETVFQVWNDRGKLILHSRYAPHFKLSNDHHTGFSDLWKYGQNWHMYSSYNKRQHLHYVVAQLSNFRQHLENQLTQDSIFIMLITYPFLGILTWIIVGRGLAPLTKVANEVKNRAATFLKPVNAASAPSEIQPLINELNALFNRLQETFDREKRFASDAAHELRTPLAALRTQAQVALHATTMEDKHDSLLKVIAGVDRSTHVVQQLLTLSRMMPNAEINEPEIIDMNTKAAEIAATLANLAIAKDIEFELLAAPNPVFIRGNSTAIGILIRNLIDNAIRYTPSGGSVLITITESNNQVLFAVEDSGPGIPEELRERVFERFFRVIGNKTTGSGLGLGIVAQISKVHSADVQLLTPSSGKGLKIEVAFPQFHQAK